MSSRQNKYIKYEKKLETIIFDIRQLAIEAKDDKFQPIAFSLLSTSSYLSNLLADIRKGEWS